MTHSRARFCSVAAIALLACAWPTASSAVIASDPRAEFESAQAALESAVSDTMALRSGGIAMVVRSWGRLGFAWGIDRNGDGRLFETVNPADMQNYDVEVRDFHAGPDGYRRLRRLTERIAARYAAREIQCDSVATDGPYGEFRWRDDEAEHRLGLNYGCQSAEASEAYGWINEVDALLTEWAKREPVSLVRQVRYRQ